MIESIHTDIRMVKHNVVDYLLIVLDVYDTIGRYTDAIQFSYFFYENQKIHQNSQITC